MGNIVQGLVSTIIPVFNRSEMLLSAVESVLNQTYRPIEIIISDDGSTDETPQTIEQLTREYPGIVRAVRNRNQGAGLAREAGRQLARGEFIQYLDSDDQLQPRKFEAQVAALQANPDYGIAYGITRLVNEKGDTIKSPYKWTDREATFLFPWLLMDRWWCTHTPLYRRSVCDAIGSWTNLRYSQDWEYDGRAGALNTKLVFCDEIVSSHMHHSGFRQTGLGKWLEPSDQVRFFTLMLSHARQAGVTPDHAEMQHFSRWVFSAARQCGARGYPREAAQCFRIAMEAAGPERSKGKDFRLYRLTTALLGWKLTGKCAQIIDSTRKRPGNDTMKLSWMD